jgi:hypothetical protein
MVNRGSNDFGRDRNRDEEFRGSEFREGAEERGGRGQRSRESFGRGYEDEGRREMQFGREHEEIGRGQTWRSGSQSYRSPEFGPQGYRGQSPQWQSQGGYGQSRGESSRGFSGESGGYGSPGYGSQSFESRESGYPSGWGYGQERSGQSFGRGFEGIDRSAGLRGTQGFGQTSGYTGYSEGQFGTPSRTRGRYTGRGPKGYIRSDDRIKEDVNDRLEQHGEIDAWEIVVMVQNGEVTLEGTVPDRRTKRLAEDVVEDSPGVKQVHNRLRIQGNAFETEGSRREMTSGQIGTSGTSTGSTEGSERTKSSSTKSSTRT